jgi:hypothetical protein
VVSLNAKKSKDLYRYAALLCAGMLLINAVAVSSVVAKNVTTYHYDNLRTGWNSQETVLTPNAVLNGAGDKHFKLIRWVRLDEQIDAQPLLVTNQQIKNQGIHDVVYVATQNNTLYAIDAHTGAILRERNFAPPVPQSALPAFCNNNSTSLGIGSTPVIDRAAGRLYVMAYTYINKIQRYVLYAVDLSTLGNAVPPVVVSATGYLRDGSVYEFNAAVSRQRAALLLANGNVYAAFASFCDVAADKTRGWVLGWRANTLTPLPHNALTNKRKTSPNSFFLTSIWMSGYGLAAARRSGDVYFITGNSDYSGATISSVFNVAESAVQVSSNLARVRSAFTPDNATQLEHDDGDFGSGGLMLLPPQPGVTRNLATAAGKDGKMYLLNADNLNNNNSGNDRILGVYDIGPCWCGPSYYRASDGTGRIVSSGGHSVQIWKVVTGATTRLRLLRSTANIAGRQDSGFFTAISSNGTRSPIVWAVSRPDSSPEHHVRLYAFSPTTGATLMSAVAGYWPHTGGNSNIVPVVANGKVYVASFKRLAIFGMSDAAEPAAANEEAPEAPVAVRIPLEAGVREIFGTVKSLEGHVMTIVKRDGSLLTVDATIAVKEFNYAPPAVDNAVQVRGKLDESGVLNASIVLHAKKDPAMWLSDR